MQCRLTCKPRDSQLASSIQAIQPTGCREGEIQWGRVRLSKRRNLGRQRNNGTGIWLMKQNRTINQSMISHPETTSKQPLIDWLIAWEEHRGAGLEGVWLYNRRKQNKGSWVGVWLVGTRISDTKCDFVCNHSYWIRLGYKLANSKKGCEKKERIRFHLDEWPLKERMKKQQPGDRKD